MQSSEARLERLDYSTVLDAGSKVQAQNIVFRRSLYTFELDTLHDVPLKAIDLGNVSMISYASSWYTNVATREGEGYLC